MKKRLLVQILILCMVFSMLPTAAWAAAEAAPYPYLEDVSASGQISAAKTLTVIATSNDLYITAMALKAVNVDSGKENIPAATGSLQVSQDTSGCYEYKQDFVLTGDIKITGGKWTFEVTSTYKPGRGSTGLKSSVWTLPNDYEKAHLYRYYTIVDGTAGSTHDSSPSTKPDSPPDTTAYCAIAAGLTLHPSGTHNAGALAVVDAGGALAAPSVYVGNSLGAPVTTGPIPTETVTVSPANGDGAWGISGVMAQPFTRWDSGEIRASFPNLRPYTKTGEAFQYAQVKYTIGDQTVGYGSRVTFNIPGAKVAASKPGIKAGEAVELRVTEARGLQYEALTGSRNVTVTDVTDGANRPVFNGSVTFINGAAAIQLSGSAFPEDALGERRLDITIGGIFQTLRAALTVETAKNTGGSGGSGSNPIGGSSGPGGSITTGSCTTIGDTVVVSSTAYVNSGTAAANVSASDIHNAVNRAVENRSTDIAIKVDIPYGASADSVQADFPASVINDLTDRTDASLTVITPLTTVTIPNDSLCQINRSAGGFTVFTAAWGSGTVHIALIQNGQAVGALSAGMKVEVSTSCTSHTSGVAAVLVSPDGAETVLPKSVLKNNGDLAVLLDTGSATIRYQDRTQYFSDVNSGYWASDAIDFVSSHNLFQGTTGTTFDGSVTMNRAMMATVLHRLERTPYAGSCSFADVPADSYYAQAAAWASSKGIIQGDGAGFSGSRAVTRQEIVVMLYRYMQASGGSKGQMGSYYSMGGAGQVAGWADEAMRWAVGSGIVQGDNGSLKPKDHATRAEVAQMMVNFVKLITQ